MAEIKKRKEGRKQTRLFNFMLTPEQYADLEEYARKRGIAASAVVKLALYEYMAAHSKEWEC